MNPIELAIVAVDSGGSVALAVIAWYVRELRKDFKHAQELSEIKHNHTDSRISRLETVLDEGIGK